MSQIITEEIYDFASQFVSGEERSEALEALCAAASAELRARMRAGVDEQAIRSAFVTAAGMLALSMYISTDTGSGIEQFSAGRLSIKKGGETVSADKLRRQAETILAAYLTDAGFEFMGVEG